MNFNKIANGQASPSAEAINFQAEIEILKKEQNAVLLAHFYQTPDIQAIADFVGDSLALAKKAMTTQCDTILFSGVHFMAETAKILNPEKRVLLPDLKAGCSLADSCPPHQFRQFLKANPDHYVISYINCTAEIKAMSDIICTSSNAEDIVHSVPKNRPIIFAPDKNLGQYLNAKTGRGMLLWDGVCEVHDRFSRDKLLILKKRYPNAKIVAHPESSPIILAESDFIGSTAKMLKFVQESDAQAFIIGTEAGILYEMQKRVPEKKLIPIPTSENNTCACSECDYMKMNTLEKIYNALKKGKPEIILDETLRRKALVPLERMMNLS